MPTRSFALILEHYPAARVNAVASTLAPSAPELAKVFYTVLLQDPLAKVHLDHSAVDSRMHSMFEGWARSVLSLHEAFDAAALHESHMQIGNVHARVGIPAEQVLHGIQIVKSHCFDLYIDGSSGHSNEDLKVGISYINELFDTCLSVMNTSYNRRTLDDERSAQALKLRITSSDLAVECERMKTELITWTRDVLFLNSDSFVDNTPDIYTSIFGSWINHKAPIYFSESDELSTIRGATARLNEMVQTLGEQEGSREDLLFKIKQLTGEVCWYVDRLVERSQRELDNRDSLTQLYGRRFLDSVLKRENQLAMTSKDTYSLLMVDLDNFKEINDNYGHQAGDAVLRSTATVISSIVRQTDFCFRYGGDEFLIVLPTSDQDAALLRAETIRRAVEEQICVLKDGTSLKITVSIGAAGFKGHPDYDTLVKDADQAVYKAKSDGRNCVRAP